MSIFSGIENQFDDEPGGGIIDETIGNVQDSVDTGLQAGEDTWNVITPNLPGVSNPDDDNENPVGLPELGSPGDIVDDVTPDLPGDGSNDSGGDNTTPGGDPTGDNTVVTPVNDIIDNISDQLPYNPEDTPLPGFIPDGNDSNSGGGNPLQGLIPQGNLIPDPLAGIRKTILIVGGLLLGFMAVKEIGDN